MKHIFQAPFNYDIYSREIVHRLFGCNNLNTRYDHDHLATTDEGDEVYYIGDRKDAEGRLLGFFYTHSHSNVERKRVGLRRLIEPYLRYDVEAAIAVFDDGRRWRLSYICDLKESTTSAKRYSYVLGDPQGQYKTPLERLQRIDAATLTLEDLKAAFSVETLSDEFFHKYHDHYDRIVHELKASGVTSQATEAQLHDYVKKMLGRIVFLHFLQKKGWLCGDQEFLKNLFFMQPLDRRADFLEQVLEPLFFGIFNTEPTNRESLFRAEGWDLLLLAQWQTLPYLNGGLFERDEVDKLKIQLPASLFEELFEFLASYNFTVDENDPDDAEVGVDPEMLGKIFESLLEDNKAKGAFYTPKEIVRYMCKESLIAYLDSKLQVNQSTPSIPTTPITSFLRHFVEQHDLPAELLPHREAIAEALREVCICDPAIGSGAFPMGLLNELWRCREAVGDTTPRYALKREIIERNIYGVDIERGAIDIARLRFWLSIVVDAEEPEPLPNFDYKFMQGNSLIESFCGCDLSHMLDNKESRRKVGLNQYGLDFSTTDTRRNLQLLLKKYFSLTDHAEKAQYRSLINSTVKSYILQQGISSTAEAQLQSLDPSANQHFFLWHTWFKDIFDHGGFDIVIGNPPYIDYRRIDMLTKVGLTKYLSYQIEKKGSLYVYFIEKGMELLKSHKRLYYINPYQYLSAESGRGIRTFIISKHKIEHVVDISNIKVFDDASTYTCINVIQKDTPQTAIRISKPDNLLNLDENITYVALKTFINKQHYTITLSTNTLIEKIETAKYRLYDVCSIFCGLSKTGFRDYVSYSKETNDYRAFVESKQIFRYVTDSKKYININVFSQNALSYFDTPCLFMTRMTSHCRVALAQKGETAGKVNVLHNFKMYDILFVLALLNSKLVDYYYRIANESKHLNGGALPFDTDSVRMIPIPLVSKQQQQSIIETTKKILISKKNNILTDTSSLENEIDKLVYQLYNLTPEEIAIIEQ